MAPSPLTIAATKGLCRILKGAEADLLDPAAAPGPRHAGILVEGHDAMRPGLLATFSARFAPTHQTTRTTRALRPDRLLLLWEGRASPTPWLWMECR